MHTDSSDLITALSGGLIVSVQADRESPLNDPGIIAAIAQSVAVPGCVGLRIDSPTNICAARQAVGLPVIGIYKLRAANGRVWITPTFEAARACVEAGASIVALDATDRPRDFGELAPDLIARVRAELNVPVMADVSTLDEGKAAAQAGADLIATTLSGYVRAPFASLWDAPDLDLVSALARELGRPIIAEGRYNTPQMACQAVQAGALAVVVGSAITRPGFIAETFVRALWSLHGESEKTNENNRH